LFAIYAFTPAGHKILRMSHEKVVNKDNELRPDEVLGVEFSLQKQQPNRRRGDLFTAARDQAKRLFAEACRAWNAAESDFAVRQLQLQEALEKSVRDDRVRKLVVHEDVHLHAASATFDRGDVAVVEAFAEAS
jgi:hypothetical protein